MNEKYGNIDWSKLKSSKAEQEKSCNNCKEKKECWAFYGKPTGGDSFAVKCGNWEPRDK